MNRFPSLLIAASMVVSAAPALGQSPPQTAAPVAAAPAPTYAPPPGYMPWAYGQGAYGLRPAPPRTERFSTGMMATGIVFVGGGSIGLLSGLVVYSSKSSCTITNLPPGEPVPDRCPGDPHHFVGATMMVASAITVALGIPLWIAGARRVPIDAAPAPPAAALVVGPRSAALRVVF